MQAIWFVLIGVLWAGFFLLEGFDFGVGMLLPLVTTNERQRVMALRSIGPTWDGNEVWLIVAGGATFAAFPDWYATVFSGFYLAFALLLTGLILRGIGLEYRGKASTQRGRAWCDRATVVGSLLPALLLGVAFANFVRGVDLTSGHDMTTGFFGLLNPYALLGGLVTLSLFAFHGSNFLALRTDGAVAVSAHRRSLLLGPVSAVLAVVFAIWTTGIRGGAASLAVGAVLCLALGWGVWRSRAGTRTGQTFVAVGIAAAVFPLYAFAALWPDVLPARNDAALSMTVHNASSSPYTLRVMFVVALVFTPLVLAYQAWAYWVFRARVTGASIADTGTPAGRLIAGAQASARGLRSPEAPTG